MLADDDGKLMLEYAQGDMRAFEVLYARHRGPLYRYLARHTRNVEAANDLFQEVWSKVIASRERYEPRAKFTTFLYRIAHNCCIDHYRRARGRPEAPPLDEDWQMAAAAPARDRPDARVERAEISARYQLALKSLPAEQRDVFLLYEESGLSLEEIGHITGVGMETAKSRLRYAVAKLRGALSEAAEAGT
jgi:RNA polymerase sigma-70 factor (ECF subfamily)